MVGKQGRGRRNRWKMRQWVGVVWLCGNRWGPHLFISSLICVEMLPGHILWWFTRNCAFVVVGFLYLPVWMIFTHFNRVFIAKIGWQWIILFLVLFFFPFLLFSPIFIQILDFHLFSFIFFIFFPFSIHCLTLFFCYSLKCCFSMLSKWFLVLLLDFVFLRVCNFLHVSVSVCYGHRPIF